MEYQEYLSYRKNILDGNEEVIDAGDLNLYGKFPRVDTIFADTSGGHIGNNIHRCHLVEDFLRVYGLDGSRHNAVEKKHISFSQGVRHSIEILMGFYSDRKWLIAADNYPFYLTTAHEVGVDFKTFETLGKNGIEELRADEESDILLVTYPLKPSGERYSLQDWLRIRLWLSQNPARRIVLDAVYLTNLEAEDELFSLFHETKQAIILYSLSKAYAAPHVAGFTFSYDNDVREAFKNITRDENSMRLCFLILNKEEGTKRREDVAGLVQTQYEKAVDAGLVAGGKFAPGYLFYVSDDNMVDTEQNILVIPPSVYSSNANGKIISTLGL
jgi:hypothetical protein